MDHKAFLKTLSPATTTQLTRKDTPTGLRHLSGHFGLIFLFALIIVARAPFWWLALPLPGSCICFLFTLQHEATHKNPFANKRLNEWVGHISGFLILQSFEWFRYFHLAHHRHTNIYLA